MEQHHPPQHQPWHALEENQLLQTLASQKTGLSSEEAARRLQEFGPNQIAEKNKTSALQLFISQFTGLVIQILFVAAFISAALGEWLDSAVIIAIVIMNGVIGFLQEYRAEQSIQALKKMAAPQTRVWRDGQVILVPSQNIVPGDLIALEAGEYIPADARLFEAHAFNSVEATLTGESMPCEKQAIRPIPVDTVLADRTNMVFMGTSCVHGTGTALICATGMNTELGKIAHLLDTADTENLTPLQKNLQDVSKKLVLICLGVVVAIFLIGYFRQFSLGELFLTSVSLAVAAIPEGLPAIVTVALAVGVNRMVKRQALMRTLPTVETLGSASVICTDKTGTLTVGEMTVRELMQGMDLFDVSGEGYAPEGNVRANSTYKEQAEASKDNFPDALLTLLAGCNNAKLVQKDGRWSAIGDPTEAALLTAAGKRSIWQEDLEKRYPKIMEIPFDSERKRMGVLRQWEGGSRLLVKGAVDVLLPLCAQIEINGSVRPITEQDREQVLAATNDMASRALRVLGAAYRTVENGENMGPDAERNLTWMGMAGMVDPPRSEAKKAIQQCHSAGIKVVMITGDHPQTAAAIAEELHILKPHEKVLSGKEIDQLSDEDLKRSIHHISAFARVTAEHKLRIIQAWQAQHQVVAMTGDGVNDAPAIKAADIGIAMGQSGTEVTKQAADMIITDDNFASIVAAIEEGRSVYANIQKTLQYLLSG
ncbi:MAG TPA: HAD-IC family P-type ATPase, partial [Pseudomonadales bacterium]|nr:HAD-IC family P-type ATPase [Pseudomonadales bacterium]